MPVPKRRKSASKTRMQRAANMKYKAFGMPSNCQSCGEPKESHRICQSCGKYNEKQIIPVIEN